MSCNHGESSLKSLPNSFSKYNNTHGMTRDTEIRLSCTMTLRMHLHPKTLLPWIIHHQTTECSSRIVNHLPNIVRTLILTMMYLICMNISNNSRNDLTSWNMLPNHMHTLKNWHNSLTNYSNSP